MRTGLSIAWLLIAGCGRLGFDAVGAEDIDAATTTDAAAVDAAEPSSIRTFGADSLIIPRDECYQYSGSKLAADLESYCVDNNTVADDGVTASYGLQWFLVRNGITVYTISNPTKSEAPGCPIGDEVPPTDGRIDGRDFCIDGGATEPVRIYARSTDTSVSFYTSSSIAYRGAPIVIDASEAAAARALIQTGNSPVAWGTQLMPTFDAVDIHIAQAAFDAPVQRVDTAYPPRIAIHAGASTNFSSLLGDAGLDFIGAAGTPAAPGLFYDALDNTALSDGTLASYPILWNSHYRYDSLTQLEAEAHAATNAFVAQGGHLVGGCVAMLSYETGWVFNTLDLEEGESCPTNSGCTALGGRRYLTSDGLTSDGVPTGWGDLPNESFMFVDVGHPFAQIGNAQLRVAGGSVQTFRPARAAEIGADSSYMPGTVRVVTTEDTNDASGIGENDGWDVVATGQPDENPASGTVTLIGGHSYSSSNEAAGRRLQLNVLFELLARTGNL